MGLYTGANNWVDQIYQFDETDVVQGGVDGIDNKPLKDLADRTAWLKGQLGKISSFDRELDFSNNAVLDASCIGAFIQLYANNMNLVIELPDVTTVPNGSIIPFNSFSNFGSMTIKTKPGQPIANLDGSGFTQMYMHHAEQLYLMARPTYWRIILANGNFFSVGEEVKARKALPNTLALRGQLLDRAQYPRLWNWVNTNLTMFQEIVTEALYWGFGLDYQGCFTNGDGVSNFRLPDERGMFERMLDLGRGVDVSRVHQFAGGYEADDIKAHTHTVDQVGDRFLDNVNAFRVVQSNTDFGGGGKNVDFTLNSSGGPETIVKNIGKLNLIKF